MLAVQLASPQSWQGFKYSVFLQWVCYDNCQHAGEFFLDVLHLLLKTAAIGSVRVSTLCCRLNYLIVSNWRRELQQMLNWSSTLDISTPSISPNLATVLCHCYPSCVLWLRHSSPLRVGLKRNSEYLGALPVSSSSPSCLIERTLCTMWRFNTESELCFGTPWKQLCCTCWFTASHFAWYEKKITSNADVLCSSRAGSALHWLHALKYTTFSFS